MANQLMKAPEGKERIIPPSDPEERVRFWIERGNRLLAEAGKFNVHWTWVNGSYSIEPGPPPRALLGNQPTRALTDDR